MLKKLFDEQATIIQRLVRLYKALQGKKQTHKRAIGWLEEAQGYIKRYQESVRNLKRQCTTAATEWESLLDVKQKQCSVLEAYISRMTSQTAAEESQSVKIFTGITIIFVSVQ